MGGTCLHKKDSATFHRRMCKHSLQYDWCFGVWNVRSLSANGGEVVKNGER